MAHLTAYLLGFLGALALLGIFLVTLSLVDLGLHKIGDLWRRRRVRRVLAETPTVPLPPVRPLRTPRHANGTPAGRVLPPLRVGQSGPRRGGPSAGNGAA